MMLHFIPSKLFVFYKAINLHNNNLTLEKIRVMTEPRILIVTLFLFGITTLYSQTTDNRITHKQMKEQYYIKDTVELTGIIGTGRYLSRTSDSDEEYFNESYHLNLEKAVNIIDLEDDKKVYEEISNIEIINPYENDIYEYYGKQAKLKGVLDVFAQRAGYYRQYSTPVYIQVLMIETVD